MIFESVMLQFMVSLKYLGSYGNEASLQKMWLGYRHFQRCHQRLCDLVVTSCFEVAEV